MKISTHIAAGLSPIILIIINVAELIKNTFAALSSAQGNEDRWFSIDKTYGNIYTKQKIDRERVSEFDLVVKASNDPDLVCDGRMCDVQVERQDFEDGAAIRVQILVEDKNDNLPR